MRDRRVAALTDAIGDVAPGVAPAVAFVRAPGRVNLIGDHTDYNDGFVFPLAIDRDCLLAVARAGPPESGPAGSQPRPRITATSLDVAGAVDVAADGSDEPRAVEPAWGRFVAGVVAALTERGVHLPALRLALSSTVPVGSGLSSSSALAVALTLALAGVDEGAGGGRTLDRTEVARAALDAEVRATGVPGGLMDQLASLFGEPGHALLIDCRALTVDPVPLPRSLGVVIVHCGLARTLVGSAYAERRAACEATAARLGVAALRDATLEQVRDEPRARHVVTENARVLDFAAALRAGDVNALGPLLLASHASLRDDYEVSTPELDLLVDVLVDSGALGARLTGAGFGGCVVALVQRNHADDLVAKTVSRYRAASGLEPMAFVAHAVGAAGPVDAEATA